MFLLITARKKQFLGRSCFFLNETVSTLCKQKVRVILVSDLCFLVVRDHQPHSEPSFHALLAGVCPVFSYCSLGMFVLLLIIVQFNDGDTRSRNLYQ